MVQAAVPRWLTVGLLTASALLGGWAVAGGAGSMVPDPDDDPARVALTALRPSIAESAGDLAPIYANGCHIRRAGTVPYHCTYGKRDGNRVLVVLGDSIVAHWWPALDFTGRREGWRVIWLTKSACPGIDVSQLYFGQPYPECDLWRRRAFAKIRGLYRVDMVLAGGSSRGAVVDRSTGERLSGEQRQQEWQAGAERTIDALDGKARKIVLLRDTPAFGFSVPSCLSSSGGVTEPCSAPRSAALEESTWAAERAAAEMSDRARATELTDRICGAERCWPVTSNLILRYRDRHHMTNTYAGALAPAMRTRLHWLMR